MPENEEERKGSARSKGRHDFNPQVKNIIFDSLLIRSTLPSQLDTDCPTDGGEDDSKEALERLERRDYLTRKIRTQIFQKTLDWQQNAPDIPHRVQVVDEAGNSKVNVFEGAKITGQPTCSLRVAVEADASQFAASYGALSQFGSVSKYAKAALHHYGFRKSNLPIPAQDYYTGTTWIPGDRSRKVDRYFRDIIDTDVDMPPGHPGHNRSRLVTNQVPELTDSKPSERQNENKSNDNGQDQDDTTNDETHILRFANIVLEDSIRLGNPTTSQSIPTNGATIKKSLTKNHLVDRSRDPRLQNEAVNVIPLEHPKLPTGSDSMAHQPVTNVFKDKEQTSMRVADSSDNILEKPTSKEVEVAHQPQNQSRALWSKPINDSRKCGLWNVNSTSSVDLQTGFKRKASPVFEILPHKKFKPEDSAGLPAKSPKPFKPPRAPASNLKTLPRPKFSQPGTSMRHQEQFERERNNLYRKERNRSRSPPSSPSWNRRSFDSVDSRDRSVYEHKERERDREPDRYRSMERGYGWDRSRYRSRSRSRPDSRDHRRDMDRMYSYRSRRR